MQINDKTDTKIQKHCAILTIAGSDSSGGAGIQADIKSISANGGYGASVITASTAQNTKGVTDIFPMSIPHIIAQMEAVFDDIDFCAIKIGMLHSSDVINAVKKTLQRYKITNIVFDPVMIATSGDKLLNDNSIQTLKEFLPYTRLITPNAVEAQVLLGYEVTLENIKSSAKKLAQQYKTSVLIKGGHLKLTDTMTDILYDYENQKTTIINNKTIQTQNTHGTGCSLSSAIATYLGHGLPLDIACIKGCKYLNDAIFYGKDMILGHGHGPINHFYNIK